MKHKSIWGLAILVMVFSLLSILVIKNQALAVWSNPDANPPSTVTNTKFVFNPVTANVDVNGKKLSGVGELCLGTVCRTTWPDAGSGGGNGSADWRINYSADRALYYATTSPASKGNVGIGTNSPQYTLEVVGPGYRNDTVKIESEALSTSLVFSDNKDNDHVWGGIIGSDNALATFNIASGARDMKFMTGSSIDDWGTERMRIKTNGNVGIGTATPATPLHIVDAQGGLMLNGLGFYGTTNLNLGTAGNVVINPAGNVGIKTATPGYPLHITDNDNTAILNIDNVGTELWTGIRLAYDGAEKWFTGFKPGNGNYFIRSGFGAAFDTLTVNRISGNVAIGTNLAPTDNNKLYIASDTYLDPVLYVKNDKVGGVAIKGWASGTAGAALSHGVDGMAKYGVFGKTNHEEGAGIWGEDLEGSGNVSSKAAHFKGDVQLEKGNNSGGYLQLTIATAIPIPSSCDTASEGGRMIYYNQTFYICAGTGGWQTIAVN